MTSLETIFFFGHHRKGRIKLMLVAVNEGTVSVYMSHVFATINFHDIITIWNDPFGYFSTDYT